MIDVRSVSQAIPHCESFCSVEKLQTLVERLRMDARFTTAVAGSSVNGVPIHHLRFGSGAVKALILGGPHCPEQIGSLTVFSLLSLLQEGHRALLEADVEWHVVPCIDPDGAILNEGWSQKRFSLESFMRNFYEQPALEQVDGSFPITYKKVIFDRPSKEALILQGILDRVRPDFFYSLHNYFVAGGAWYALSRDIGTKSYRELYALLAQYRIPLQRQGPASALFPRLDQGILTLPSLRLYYDHLERLGVAIPESFLKGEIGAGSSDYLAQIKPSALTFVAELVQVRHPSDTCEKDTAENLRHIKLRLHADNLYLATAIINEWERVAADLDSASPFFRKISSELLPLNGRLHEELPLRWGMGQQLQDILINPADGKRATESERFAAYMVRFKFLCNAHVFVRLLKASRQTQAVREASERLEGVFDEALSELEGQIDSEAFEVIDCDTLAKVQLGSGLIALNALLVARTGTAHDA